MKEERRKRTNKMEKVVEEVIASFNGVEEKTLILISFP
jgi:hypothetical protein